MKLHVVRATVATLALAVCGCSTGKAEPENTLEASFKVSDRATAADVGLPAYPGAKLHRDGSDSSPAANVGLATPLFGFKVVAVKLESADRPERVAAFYRRALAKYGKVLECSEATGSKSEQEGETVCDSDESEQDGIVYKVGTEHNQRIVAIKPLGSGTQFDLVHVNVRGE